MLVTGYHGTSLEAAEKIIREGRFTSSANEYDWLGDGAYFFQDAPRRAFEWSQRRFGPAAAVVGVVVDLVDCMDFLDIRWCSLLAEAHDQFVKRFKEAKRLLPRQSAGAHRLDRAVINYCVGVLLEQGILIRSVRAAFLEGKPLYPNSAIFDRAHVQVAVRDLSTIGKIWIEPVTV
jgi:hypothetical protein